MLTSRLRTLAAIFALASLASFPALGQELAEINKMISQGQTEKALERLNAYLGQKPKDPVARFKKGVILTEQGKTNEAIAVFQGITEDNPELPEPYNNLAVLYASKGQYEKSKTALEMAIQTHPSYATAHENLGDIYAKMASIAYDKALQLDKSNTSAQTKLALIREIVPGGKSGAQTTSAKPAASTAPQPTPAPVSAAPVKEAPKPAETRPLEIKPAPAASTAPKAPEASGAKAGGDDKQDVLATVTNWAKAWSSQNFDGYLSTYASNFAPPGETHAAWTKARRDRIVGKKSINVSVLNPVVNIEANGQAVVKFRQSYKSEAINTTTSKTLTLAKLDGSWKIVKEEVGK